MVGRIATLDVGVGRTRALQLELVGRVRLVDDAGSFDAVCGVDLAYEVGSDRLVAAAVVLEAATLEVLDQAVVEGTATVAYRPGFLSFREVPWVLLALNRLRSRSPLTLDGDVVYRQPETTRAADHLARHRLAEQLRGLGLGGGSEPQ